MEAKKIVSTLLAAGMAVPALPVYAHADSSTSLSESATIITNDNKEDSFISSVVVVDQTDTSITIKWNANAYKEYSISVNNKVIANNLVDDTYTITDLKSASEYFIQISAYDENGVLAVSSDEICAYTNLTVSSNYTLTNDIKAANVNIDSGTLNLNGHTMTVTGNVWVSRSYGNAYVNINKGRLNILGDFNLCHANKNTSMFSESVFIDNMPPRKPVLSISEITSTSISFEWDSEDNIGIKIYKNDQLLRATADNQYVDTAVVAGEKYSYYVIAIDASGNVSEASAPITLVAGEDENAPESVLKTSNLTDNNKILTIYSAPMIICFRP